MSVIEDMTLEELKVCLKTIQVPNPPVKHTINLRSLTKEELIKVLCVLSDVEGTVEKEPTKEQSEVLSRYYG